MSEAQTNYQETINLKALEAFHPSLQTRIDAIRAGQSPNGQHPNGTMSAALEAADPQHPEGLFWAKKTFIEEYQWALELYSYAYTETIEPVAFWTAAMDGFFIAAQTYDADEEPDFLKHLGSELDNHLTEIFGEEVPKESLRPIPALDQFEAFVREHRPIEQPVEHNTVSYLSTIGAAKRFAMYRSGEMTYRELMLWTGNFPHEVPIVNDEFEWIARSLADFD